MAGSQKRLFRSVAFAITALLLVSSSALAQLTLNSLTDTSPGISSNIAQVGAASFTLTLNGSGFTSNSIARFGSTNLATTFVSANRLTALVPSSLLKTTGAPSITVVDGNTTSNALAFTVTYRADVNGNGSVNIADALVIALSSGGLFRPAVPVSLSDVNFNDVTSIGDALVLALFTGGVRTNLDRPAITSTSAVAPVNAGDSITLTGPGFSPAVGDNAVVFSMLDGSFLSIAPSSVTTGSGDRTMTVTVPSGAASGPVFVKRNDVEVPGRPIVIPIQGSVVPVYISNVTPNANLQPGTTSVTLTGSGFDPTPANNAITFSGPNGTIITTTAATASTVSLSVVVPAPAISGFVYVTVSGRESNHKSILCQGTPTVLRLNQLYYPDVAGEPVLIEGTGFNSAAPSDNQVLFTAPNSSEVQGQVVAVGRTELIVLVPANAITGTVKVKTTGGTVTSNTLGFTAASGSGSRPLISSINPDSGTAGTTVNVTITGTNFVPGATTVTAASTGITVTAVNVPNATSLTANLVIQSSAALGATSISVVTTGGLSSIAFNVLAPISTIQLRDSVTSNSTNEFVVNAGNTLQVGVRILDSTGQERTGVPVQYTSLNSDIASIDVTGLVRGLRAGFSTLTVTSGNAVATGIITVVEVTTGSAADNVSGIAIDSSQQIYLALTSDQTIRTGLDLTQPAQIYAGMSGSAGFSDNVRLQSLFRSPSFVALNQADGTLYVADSGNHRIRRITPGPNGRVDTIAGTGTAGSQDGAAASATFRNPQGIALDSAGYLWVADTGNHTIRRINLTARTVQTVAGLAGTSGSTDGTGTAARFNGPIGIAIRPETLAESLDRLRNGGAPPPMTVLVADTGNGLLRRVKETGVVDTLQVTTPAATPFMNASIKPAILAATPIVPAPTGIAVDAAGNIYVTDPASGQLAVLLGNGQIVQATQSGTFSGPRSVIISRLGRILVADAVRTRELHYGEPQITSLTPDHVPTQGNVTITVRGNNFSPDSIVVVGATIVSGVHIDNTQTLTFTIPLLPSGIATLTVQNRGGLAQRPLSIDSIPLSSLPPGYITTIAGGTTFVGDGSQFTSATLGPANMAMDSSGNLFIADWANNRVRRVDARTGVVTTVAGNGSIDLNVNDGGPAVAASLAHPAGVAVDASGNLYIADGSGDYSDLRSPSAAPYFEHRRIRKVNVVTGIISSMLDCVQPSSCQDDQGLAANALTVDAAGNIYFIGASGGNAVNKVAAATGVVTTIAGNPFSPGYSGDNGPASAALLNVPSSLATDTAGNLYIADSSNDRIRKIDAATGIISTVAGGSTLTFDGALATQSKLYTPTSIAIDKDGNLYIGESGRGRIRKVNASSGTISTVAGNGTGFSGDGGLALSAQLDPSGILLDASGDLLIAEFNNHRVRKVTSRNGTVNTLGGTGESNYSGTGGPAIAATLSLPWDITFDQSGNLYVAEVENNQIRKVSADTGAISVVAGMGLAAFSGDNGPATAAALSFPYGIAMDLGGNLFIADTWNSRIRKIAASTGTITTVAGTGEFAYSGDNGPAISAVLNKPISVAVDSAGNLFIADTGNNKVRKIAAANGTITTIADLTSSPQYVALDPAGNIYVAMYGGILKIAAGTGVVTQVPNSTGFYVNAIRFDSAGNLFFSDFTNRVRRIGTDGSIVTVAGNGAATTVQRNGVTNAAVGDNGPARNATLDMPSGMAFDSAGNLFIVDAYNQRVRAVRGPVPSSPAVAQLAIVSGNNQTAQIGAVLPQPLIVEARDQNGNTLTGIGVTFSVTSGGGSVDPSMREITASNGRALVTATLGTSPGTALFSASVNGIPAVVFSATATAASSSIPTLTSISPGSGTQGNTISVTLTGNGFVTGNTVVTAGGSGVVVSRVTVTNANSLSATLVLSGPAGSRSVAVRTPGGTSGNVSFTVIAGTLSSATAFNVTTPYGLATQLGTADGTGTAARFSAPRGIWSDGANLYVADTNNYAIRKINLTTGAVTTLAGLKGTAGSADGTGTAARFVYPGAIWGDGLNLYVADSVTIRKVVLSSGVVTTLAGQAGALGSADDTGTAARFLGISGLWGDNNNLYIADAGNNTIRKMNLSSLAVTTVAGDPGTPAMVDGAATDARFSQPNGLWSDGANLFISDYANHAIRKMNIVSGNVSTVAAYYAFNGPAGLWGDGVNLYVLESANNIVSQIVLSTAAVSIIAGQSGINGSADGSGSAARFWSPNGIWGDGGRLYVADTGNSTIRKLDTVVLAPAISAITPFTGSRGTTISANLTGTYFLGATAVTFSGTGVTGTILGGGTATNLPISIAISADTAESVRTITVHTSAGTSAVFTGFTISPVAWQVSNPGLPAGVTINSIWARNRNDAFVWGARNIPNTTTPESYLYHWNGAAWSQAFYLASASAISVFGTGASEVWISAFSTTANASVVYRSVNSGVNWTQQTLPAAIGSARVGSLTGTPNNIHASGAGNQIIRFNGTSWSALNAGGIQNNDPPGPIVVNSATEGYYTTCHGFGFWDGTSWAYISNGWDFCNVSQIWGTPTYLHTAGDNSSSNGVRVWRQTGPTNFSQTPVLADPNDGPLQGGYLCGTGQYGTATGLWGSGGSDIWVSGRLGVSPTDCTPTGRLYHYNGTAWSNITSLVPAIVGNPLPAVTALTGTASDDVWIALADGRVLRFTR